MNTAIVSNGSSGVKVTLQGLARKNNFLALNLEKWRHMAEAIYHASRAQAEQIFGDFIIKTLNPEDRSDLTPDSMIQIFREELETVKKDIAARIYRYMPATADYNGMLPLSTSDGVADDPIELLKSIYELKENQPIGKKEFEWIRNMEMAIFYCYISARHNRWQFVNDGEEMVQRFTKWLDHGCQLNLDLMKVGLDPSDRWRVHSVHCPKIGRTPRPQQGLKYIVREVFVATFKAGMFNRERIIKAIVQARRKTPFEGFAKRFREPQSELWPDVPDMFGIRLVYLTKEDMVAGINLGKLRAIWNNNPEIRYCHTTNKYSQKKMRIKKQRILVNGRQSEIQHVRLEDWLNIEYSVAPENHERYHLRWYTDEEGMFMHILPPCLYGKDWASESVRSVLSQHLIEKTRENNEQRSANL